jgi:hypothetical protein
MSIEESSCPICYEALCINGTNVLQTECKHSFHTNCFLKHTSINGYKCPYCRHNLVESSNTEEVANTTTLSNQFNDYTSRVFDEYEDYGRFESGSEYGDGGYDDDDGEETDPQIPSLESRFLDITNEDYILAPFRWLMQKCNNEVAEEYVHEDDDVLPLDIMYHNNSLNYQCDQQRIQENKDDLMELFTMINKKKIPYEKLLAAYMYHISADYSHSLYADKCNSDTEKALLSIHEKTLSRYCLRMNHFDTYHSYDHEEE